MRRARLPLRPVLTTGVVVLLALAAAVAASASGMPLAWLLPPALIAAAFTLAGQRPLVPKPARAAGQVLIGGTIGLYVSAPVVLATLPLLPIMIATSVLSITLAGVLSVLVARLGGVDEVTAYYAMMPGGLSEMAFSGRDAGGSPEPIVLAHTLRVVIVLLVVTGAAWLLPAAPVSGATGPVLPIVGVGLAIAVAAAAGWLGDRFGLNNPWVIGPMLAVGTLSSLGSFSGLMPSALLALGQFLVGLSIGIRFDRQSLARLAPFAMAVTAALAMFLVLLALLALLLSWLLHMDWRTLLLALAPGGFSEMTATAVTLEAGVLTVTGFHLVRALLVNGGATYFRRLLDRLGLFALLRTLLQPPTRGSD